MHRRTDEREFLVCEAITCKRKIEFNKRMSDERTDVNQSTKARFANNTSQYNAQTHYEKTPIQFTAFFFSLKI